MGDLRKFPLHLNKLLFQVIACWKAHRLNKKYKYDAIWAMMAHSTGIPAGLFKTFHKDVPYILTLQEGDPTEYIEKKMRIFGPLFSRAFTLADRIQTISTFLASWARDMGFTGPLEVIPNAVNTAHFSQEFSKEEIKKAQSDLGKKDGDIFIVTTSRLVKKNAVDDVICAMAELPENMHFVVFGTGPDEDMLKGLAKEKEVAGRVHFRGHIDHKDMPLYLKACDIFTRPSRSEGMGNSFVEAMAAQLPVIATQEGGIADFLFDAKRDPDKPTTGWAVDKNSPEQIAEAVRGIIGDPEKVAHVKETAKKMALEKYDWGLVAKNMQTKVFDRLFE